MKLARYCPVVLLFCLASVTGTAAQSVAELRSYLSDHWQSPEHYVIAQFQTHDVVFLGEYHRIRHDAEFVRALIPLLYRAGVFNLGFEFANAEDQDDVDRLINAPIYDESLARKILFRGNVGWGYKEYLDIYRAAWQLNGSLPKRARRFRVVNLMYRADWPALKTGNTPEDRSKVWTKGPGDEYMAGVVLDEFVAKKQKALIYCGIHHAFTRFEQTNTGADNRLGNIIYRKIGTRTMTISLHAPWPSSEGWTAPVVKPANGVIDDVMASFEGARVGFDVIGSPFSELKSTDAIYAEGRSDFSLGDFTDGYIFQKPLREYRGVTADPQFITQDNIAEAIDHLANPEARKWLTTPESFFRAIQEDADIQRRFHHLWEDHPVTNN